MRRSDLVQLLAVRPDDEVVVAVGSRRFVLRGVVTDRETGEIILLTQSVPTDGVSRAQAQETDPVVRQRNGLAPLPDWSRDTGGQRTHPYVD